MTAARAVICGDSRASAKQAAVKCYAEYQTFSLVVAHSWKLTYIIVETITGSAHPAVSSREWIHILRTKRKGGVAAEEAEQHCLKSHLALLSTFHRD